MKELFRKELFDKIREAMLGVSGKQRDIAKALDITQNDVSLIKLGRERMLSTDKLIDIALKCGWTFKFSMVEGDATLLVGAVAKGKADFDAQFMNTFGGDA